MQGTIEASQHCSACTVRHLYLELGLQNFPHEIVVVDDGSSDGTCSLLTELQKALPELWPVFPIYFDA